MKMTMHIDEALLERVRAAFDCASKTEAVEMALQEMDRKIRYRAFVSKPSPFSPSELRSGVDPGYDVLAMRVAEQSPSYRSSRGRKRNR